MKRFLAVLIVAGFATPAPLAAQDGGEADLALRVKALSEQVEFLLKEVAALRDRVAALEARDAGEAPAAPPAASTPEAPATPPAAANLPAGTYDLDVAAYTKALETGNLQSLAAVLSGATAEQRAAAEEMVRARSAAAAASARVELVLRADGAFVLTSSLPGLPARAEGAWTESPQGVLLRAARIEGVEMADGWEARSHGGRLELPVRAVPGTIHLVRRP